jgi:hypothetical protein
MVLYYVVTFHYNILINFFLSGVEMLQVLGVEVFTGGAPSCRPRLRLGLQSPGLAKKIHFYS